MKFWSIIIYRKIYNWCQVIKKNWFLQFKLLQKIKENQTQNYTNLDVVGKGWICPILAFWLKISQSSQLSSNLKQHLHLSRTLAWYRFLLFSLVFSASFQVLAISISLLFSFIFSNSTPRLGLLHFATFSFFFFWKVFSYRNYKLLLIFLLLFLGRVGGAYVLRD